MLKLLKKYQNKWDYRHKVLQINVNRQNANCQNANCQSDNVLMWIFFGHFNMSIEKVNLFLFFCTQIRRYFTNQSLRKEYFTGDYFLGRFTRRGGK